MDGAVKDVHTPPFVCGQKKYFIQRKKMPKRMRCTALTKKGVRCKNHSKFSLCHHHFANVDAFTCSICLDDDESPQKRLSCGHIFHRCCIMEWVATNPTCPLCRSHCQLVVPMEEDMDDTESIFEMQLDVMPPPRRQIPRRDPPPRREAARVANRLFA